METEHTFPLIPRTTLFGNPDRAQVRLSPDGTRIAYLAPLDGVLNVWVAPVDDLDAARPENQLSFNAVAEAFLAQYLEGRFEPVGDAFAGSTIQVPVGETFVPGIAEASAGH